MLTESFDFAAFEHQTEKDLRDDIDTHLTLSGSVDTPTGSALALSFLDTGSTADFISESYMLRCGLQASRLQHAIPLRTADDKLFCTISRTVECTYRLGNHVEVRSFYVAPIPHYDIVLGIPWHRDHDPDVSYRSRSVTFRPHICGPRGCLPHKSSGVRSLTIFAKKPSTVAKLLDPSIKTLSALSFLREATDPDSETLVVSIDEAPHTATQFADKVRPFLSAACPNTFAVLSALSLAATSITEEDYAKHMKGSSELSEDELKALLPKRLHKWVRLFSKQEADTLPPHSPEDHRIELVPNSTPPFVRGYRPMSQQQLEALRKYLDDQLRKGFIRPSRSSAASPVLIIRKPHGGLRVCVDYRGLNAITLKSRCTLPLLSETLTSVRGCKFFTALDVAHAFNRIRIADGDEWLTSFTCRYGQFEYLVMPFGLCNAPSTFQAYINQSLTGLIDQCCSAYIDDVLVYSRTLEEHEAAVEKVFERLSERGLFLDITKCVFYKPKISYLGMMISGDGVEIHPDKLQAIRDWSVPANVKDVQSFVGFMNYFRRFIPNFSRVAAPLYGLMKGKAVTRASGRKGVQYVPFSWSAACDEAFATLKSLAMSAPVMAHFNPSRITWIETDASNFVVAGILSQEDDEGRLHPVAYYSKRLEGAENNYPIYDRELLAVVRAFECWAPELLSLELPAKVLTDHQALRTFMTTKQLTERQARWAEFLSQFSFKISYRPGVLNGKADLLSRRSQDITDEGRQQRLTTLLTSDMLDPDLVASFSALWLNDTIHLATTSVSDPSSPPTLIQNILERIRSATSDDPISTVIRNSILSHARRLPPIVARSGYHMSLADLSIQDDILYFRGKVLVPPVDSIRLDLLSHFHDHPLSGHPGDRIMFDALLRSYYWPTMRKDCIRYVRNCHNCTRSKGSTSAPQGFLNPLPVSAQPWLNVTMDLIENLPECTRNGRTFRHIFVAVDRLTKDKEIAPLTSKSDHEILATFHRRVVCRHGCPFSVISDRGSAFISDAFAKYAQQHSISLKHSSAEHPQTDGQTENANRVIKNYLRASVNHLQDNWVDFLPQIEFVWRNSVHRSTGMSPFFAIHGFNARVPLSTTSQPSAPSLPSPQAVVRRRDALNTLLYRNLRWAQDEQSSQANKHRVQHPQYRVGDLVFVKSIPSFSNRPSHSLSNKREGPWPIIRVIDDKCYQVCLPPHIKSAGHCDLFSPDKLTLASGKPFPNQNEPPPEPEVVEDSEGLHDEWAVKDIVDCRLFRGNVQYKATYEGNWDEWNSNPPWQDWTDFEHSADKILAFHSRHPRKPSPPEFFLQPSVH